MEHNLVKQLKEYIANTPKEVRDKDWENICETVASDNDIFEILEYEDFQLDVMAKNERESQILAYTLQGLELMKDYPTNMGTPAEHAIAFIGVLQGLVIDKIKTLSDGRK